MRYPLLATQLYGIPLLLHPDKAAVIEAVFRSYSEGGQISIESAIRGVEPQAVAYRAERFADKPYVVTEGGVGVLPILGTMVHRGSFLDSMSGMTNYQSIERRMMQMAADPDVKAILMELDTPGGQAAGVFDLAKQIGAIDKPVWASVNEAAMSAGYALAAVADRVLLTRTGMVGSIGVIALHVDQSKKNQKDGCTYTAITAGAKKGMGSPHAPLSDEARSEIQARVDQLYEHFVDHVAEARKLSPEAVRATEAGSFAGQDALDVGLADEIMSFNEALAALEAEVATRQVPTAGFRQSIPKGVAMDKKEVPAEHMTAEQVTAQVAAARVEGAAEMQARVRDILSCDEATGRAKLASHLAFSTSMGVEEAKGLLAASAQEAAPAAESAKTALAAGMEALKNPSVGTEGALSGDENTQAEATSLWARSNQKLHRVK